MNISIITVNYFIFLAIMNYMYMMDLLIEYNANWKINLFQYVQQMIYIFTRLRCGYTYVGAYSYCSPISVHHNSLGSANDEWGNWIFFTRRCLLKVINEIEYHSAINITYIFFMFTFTLNKYIMQYWTNELAVIYRFISIYIQFVNKLNCIFCIHILHQLQ